MIKVLSLLSFFPYILLLECLKFCHILFIFPYFMFKIFVIFYVFFHSFPYFYIKNISSLSSIYLVSICKLLNKHSHYRVLCKHLLNLPSWQTLNIFLCPLEKGGILFCNCRSVGL